MNHYDDLQRFKDKTRNQKYEFKDLSAQNLSPDHGSWAIMNQLAPATEESKLAMGGHVSLPQPQAVAPDVFASEQRHERVESIDTINSIESTETTETTENSNESVLPPVDTDLPAVTAPSIFREVAGQLASQSAASVAPSAQPAANPVVPTTTTAPAPSATAPADYSRLFATKAPEANPTVEKNQPLQTLLERIASCR